ncbi:DUF3861 domain-containing protein [Archangium violaceum]|uniref:DUF3861 domain-containing protein n=1 Tax=Archangium violaceum TaxID=83451 RepID=UPI00193AE360|nr:DUF3861 domain-containing protein [Archangium violaceum]QRK11449.1 DUF3861 domain-containing protein [Archangium violaceum]
MLAHRYRLTLEHLATRREGETLHTEPVTFEFENHDDIFEIISRMRRQEGLSEGDQQELAVGLKLFSEVMLRNREHPLFQGLQPHFRDFMKTLKERGKAAAP